MLEIRNAEKKDIPACIRLLQDLFKIEADFTPDPEKQIQGLELLLKQNSKSIFLVGIINNKVIGMVTMQFVISSAEGGYSGLLEDMIINKNYRGKGYGKKLLQAITEKAFQQGVKRIQLLADKNNHKALDFYHNQNWQSTSLIILRKY